MQVCVARFWLRALRGAEAASVVEGASVDVALEQVDLCAAQRAVLAVRAAPPQRRPGLLLWRGARRVQRLQSEILVVKAGNKQQNCCQKCLKNCTYNYR